MNGLFEKSDSLNLPVECFVFDASENKFPIKPHWHYFAEFIYMLEGSARMCSGENTYMLHEGDFIIFHPSSVHSIYSAKEKPPVYAVLKCDLNKFGSTPAYSPKIRDIFRYAEKCGARVHFDSYAAGDINCKNIFSECVTEMKEYKYGRELVLKSEIYRLLMSIIRYWISEGMTVNRQDISFGEGSSVENITEYIDLSLGDSIRIDEIAKHCGMSYSCFAKKFREQYGMSCKQYIERMRIYKVEEYLLFTDFDLNYISQETGFSDCSHLIKCFKKHRGVTPKQFRINERRTKGGN